MGHEADNLPPVPSERYITPAPEDFENPPAIPNLLWPLLWIGVAYLCWRAVQAVGWLDYAH